MIDLLEAARSVQRLCTGHRWRFCFIGGLAVQRLGEPRLTQNIVLKAFASRPKDWVDVEGVLARQRDALNWRYIWAQLRPLAELKAEPEITETLRRLRKR